MKNPPLPTLVPELSFLENLMRLTRKDPAMHEAVLLAAVDALHEMGEDKLAESVRRRVAKSSR